MSTPSISVTKCGSAAKRRLERAPVVVGRPVVGQRLDRLEPHALRGIRLPVGPPRRGDAPPQVGELLVGDVDRERADSPPGVGRARCVHGCLPVGCLGVLEVVQEPARRRFVRGGHQHADSLELQLWLLPAGVVGAATAAHRPRESRKPTIRSAVARLPTTATGTVRSGTVSYPDRRATSSRSAIPEVSALGLTSGVMVAPGGRAGDRASHRGPGRRTRTRSPALAAPSVVAADANACARHGPTAEQPGPDASAVCANRERRGLAAADRGPRTGEDRARSGGVVVSTRGHRRSRGRGGVSGRCRAAGDA